MNLKTERLHKVIANAGYCSRRKAELLIANGKVKINDQVITQVGIKVTTTDIIKINNKILTTAIKYYLLFYKPINTLTTLSDPKNRPTIMKYFSDFPSRVYPIGRLDFDTTGLLLMTNDGDFSHAIMHPKFKIKKVYEVIAKGFLSDFQINFLQNGVKIEEDFVTSPAIANIINFDEKNHTTLLHLTIYEGHKNQVKKMLIAVGSKVINLKRIKIGELTLTNLQPGQYRSLTTNEIKKLIKSASG